MQEAEQRPSLYRAFTLQPKNLGLYSLAWQRELADVMRLRAWQLARRPNAVITRSLRRGTRSSRGQKRRLCEDGNDVL